MDGFRVCIFDDLVQPTNIVILTNKAKVPTSKFWGSAPTKNNGLELRLYRPKKINMW